VGKEGEAVEGRPCLLVVTVVFLPPGPMPSLTGTGSGEQDECEWM
jgi:hypothetical protein